jgi:hypothetical protein
LMLVWAPERTQTMKGKRYPTEDTYHSLGMMPKIPFVLDLALGEPAQVE